MGMAVGMESWEEAGSWQEPGGNETRARLRVATPSDPLFSPSCIFTQDCPLGLRGMNYDLFKHFADILGLELETVEADGYKYQDESGRWHGVLGMVHRGEVDGAATLMYQEVGEELGVADWTLPLSITYGGLVIQTPLGHDTRWVLRIFNGLQWEVWLALLICLLLIGAVNLAHDHLFCSNNPGNIKIIFNVYFLNCISAISLVFLSINYQSMLTSAFMVNPTPSLPIKDFDGLATALESGLYSLVTHKYSQSFLYTVNHSSFPPFRRIYESFAYNPLVLFIFTHKVLRSSRAEAMEAVSQSPGLVYFASSDLTFQLAAPDNCRLTFVSDPWPKYLAFAFRKGSRYADLFNRVMYPFSFSAVDIKDTIARQYVHPRRCDAVTARLVEGETPVFFKLVSGAFAVLTAGGLASLLSFALEILSSPHHIVRISLA